MNSLRFSSEGHIEVQFEEPDMVAGHAVDADAAIDLREVYFLMLHFLSAGPCQKTFRLFCNELLEHQLLPRRYHAWYSRTGAPSQHDNDDGVSFPLSHIRLTERYAHIEKDHLVKLLEQLVQNATAPLYSMCGRNAPNAANVPTLLGSGSCSLLAQCNEVSKKIKRLPAYLRWPHMQADQVRGLSLREIGGGCPKHHRAPSIHLSRNAIAKPSMMVQKMQNIKKLRGHRAAVYCAIFDCSGRFVITGSDDRLVKIWSMEMAFCLVSCRGHEGDITDLAVSSNNALVASASNDYSIRVWRLPDGTPISVLRGHTGAVAAIAFSPRPGNTYHLLSSSDDGTCRIWDARNSHCKPRVYLPRAIGNSNGPSSSNSLQCHQILCCSYNADGTVFVTGSSDTFARVWSACKLITDDLEQPNYEIDVLAGHENDVNYVQFSGCAVAPRAASTDSSEDKNKKFKNSRFNHDNIVTCSRDGSAIIWVPRSRKSHGKSARWTRAYHLKVPPPPMPPQPPRGGPRQRYLPTPRGVNMIIWSLDNRFVLAAIMDCRICVWNASDGSLVHCLTGHSESTYVLDVHPFNPRIAMSAGYDGKMIVWDIWEGTPIWVYEIGRFKLVDGKFSQDGTSIVISDDAGQIYLLNTGQGESQKDAQYDQFFLGDYRPLIQDTLGNIQDKETQLPTHVRNLQDPLCDSSMIPYIEPYQSMYQKRRLGILGKEWHPCSMKFTTGREIGLGQEILPLADLDAVIEPLPEFVDAMYWEPENEVMNDETDSEYNITEEYSTDGERGSLSSSSSSDPDGSAEGNTVDQGYKDGLQRSIRRKRKSEVKLVSSARSVKLRNLDDYDGALLRTKSKKKQRKGRKTSKRKSFKSNSLRPQRVAARNARNLLSQFTGSSVDEDDGGSEDESSENETVQLKDSEAEQALSSRSEEAVKSLDPLGSQTNIGKTRKLVLKFSLRDPKRLVTSEKTTPQFGNPADLTISSSLPNQETLKEACVNVSSDDAGSSSANADTVNMDLSENHNGTAFSFRDGDLKKVDDQLETSVQYKKQSETKCGEVKGRPSKQIKSGDWVRTDTCIASFGSDDGNREDITLRVQPNIEHGLSCSSSQIKDSEGKLLSGLYREEEQFKTGALENMDGSREKKLSPEDVPKSSLWQENHQQADISSAISGHRNLSEACVDYSGSDVCKLSDMVVTNYSEVVKENPQTKPIKIRIKSQKNFRHPDSLSRLKVIKPVADPPSARGESMSLDVEDTVNWNDGCGGIQSNLCRSKGYGVRLGKIASNSANHNHDSGMDFPGAAADATCRTRSMALKATCQEANHANINFKLRQGPRSMRSSKSEEKFPIEPFDGPSSEAWTTSCKPKNKSRSSRNKGGICYDVQSSSARTKSNWLVLSQQEEGCRYIPQLGDEVVYLRQGHQSFLESGSLTEVGPWESIKKKIRAVEFCLIEDLDYSSLPGSGESCCKLTLRFSDPSSYVLGETFRFTLPELSNFPDFVVERAQYDATIGRNWTSEDKCLVWWRDGSEQDGTWWEGQILYLEDRSDEFPGSPWEKFAVDYEGDPIVYYHSPWELHDPESPWKHPYIGDDIKDKMLSLFNHLQQSVSRNQDCYGILRLNQVAEKEDFVNRFPVPLSPNIIELRLKNNYYRSLEAVKHDIRVMMSNVQSYFGKKNAEILLKMKRLSELLSRRLSKL